jgi:lipoyl(octanoyl) transferase
MNEVVNKRVQVIELGLIDYAEAWAYQTRLFEQILAIKTQNRINPDGGQQTPNFLLFCQHPHVYTLGKSGDEKNLLIQPAQMATIGATYHHTNRGGDITYHGPGQLVMYPVIDLENFFTDIHRYMRTLEEAVILTLADYGVAAGRIKGLTGVWLGEEANRNERKICALGVKTSRWVTLHGLALNVNTDLSFFEHIVPCGIAQKAVTSLRAELGHRVEEQQVAASLQQHFVSLMGMMVAAEKTEFKLKEPNL